MRATAAMAEGTTRRQINIHSEITLLLWFDNCIYRLEIYFVIYCGWQMKKKHYRTHYFSLSVSFPPSHSFLLYLIWNKFSWMPQIAELMCLWTMLFFANFHFVFVCDAIKIHLTITSLLNCHARKSMRQRKITTVNIIAFAVIFLLLMFY